jgi:O-acetyl-ADP-ribose deacetylase (regulator of RNase III)
MRTAYGDASLPPETGPRIIAHIVNDQGKWGAGFTRSLSANWPEAERDYRLWHRHRYEIQLDPHKGFGLASVRYTLVQGKWKPEGGEPEPPVWIAHMVAQQGLIGWENKRPLRYDALGACLREVGLFADLTKASVHMPKIGTGLAGGDWNIIKELINDALTRNGIKVVVYELEPTAA